MVKRLKKFISLGCLVTAVLLLAHFLTIKHVHAEKSPPKPAPPSIQQLVGLSSSINSTMNSNPNIDVSVSLIDLNTNRLQHFGEHAAFEAGSTAKLITAADYLHHVEQGKASLNQIIEGSSAQSELQQMIEVSDDNSWYALNDFLGHADLSSFAASQGLSGYDADTNTLTSNDIALLLQKLYQGKLLNSQHTRLLLGYMAVANYNGYIASVVPANVKFYHKAGFLDDRVHDAAIIDNGKRPIVLVIFTKNELDDTQADPAQVQIIQAIAQAVLNAYSIK